MDSTDLVKLIKKAAADAFNASKPCNLVFGRVDSTAPLRIQVNQKLTLDKSQLIIPEHLTDHEVRMMSNGYASTYIVYGALRSNDKVLMIQAAGGQQYAVIDRIGVYD